MTMPASERCRLSSGEVEGGELGGSGRFKSLPAIDIPKDSSKHSHLVPKEHLPQPMGISAVRRTSSSHAQESLDWQPPQVMPAGGLSSGGETI
jgi:hypothetical protein